MLSCIVQFLVFGYVRDYFAHLPTSANHLQQILTLFSWCLQKAGTNCFRQQMQLLQESQWRTRLLNGGCSEPSYSTLSGTISLSTSRAASFDVGSSVCTAPSNLVPNGGIDVRSSKAQSSSSWSVEKDLIEFFFSVLRFCAQSLITML
jgi:hypothetical protein